MRVQVFVRVQYLRVGLVGGAIGCLVSAFCVDLLSPRSYTYFTLGTLLLGVGSVLVWLLLHLAKAMPPPRRQQQVQGPASPCREHPAARADHAGGHDGGRLTNPLRHVSRCPYMR